MAAADSSGSRQPSLQRWAIPAGGLPLTCLAVIGIFRPQLPGLIRDHWTLAIGATALLAALGLGFGYSKKRSGEAVLVALFPLVLAAMYLQPQRLASDGVLYFAPLRSLVVDGDLDFENEYRILGAYRHYSEPTATGKLPNTFSIGPALIWSPFYLAVHALAHLGLLRPTGFGYPYFTAIASMTTLGGFLGVICLFRLTCLYFEERVALVATLLIWLGTFHLWYMVFEPSMSHALAMASVALYLLLIHRGLVVTRDYVVAGAIGGILILIRWQNAIFLPLAWWTTWRATGRLSTRSLMLGLGVTALVFLPQMVYWKILYGQFLTVPQGGGFLKWDAPQLVAVLFSSRHGLLSWSPVLWLALLGFLPFGRKAPALAAGLVVASLAELYLNAAVSDWWAGSSFGARRFDGTLPGFGLALAACIEWLVPLVRRNALRVTAMILAPFVLWNVALMTLAHRRALPVDGAVSFLQAGTDAAELAYQKTGYLFSWPAVLYSTLVQGRPPSVYDLTGAHHPANNVEIRMGATDQLHLGDGWSLPERSAAMTYREGSAEGASIFVALREAVPYRLDVQAMSDGEVTVSVNGSRVVVLDFRAGETVSCAIPANRIRKGVNQILFTSVARPFSVSRLRLSRAGDPSG